jgi:hypothetical protein
MREYREKLKSFSFPVSNFIGHFSWCGITLALCSKPRFQRQEPFRTWSLIYSFQMAAKTNAASITE